MSKKARRSDARSKPNAKRRKGFLSVALPWLKRFGFGLAGALFVIWFGAWLVITGTLARTQNWASDQMVQASAQAGFRIQNLLVEGRVHTDGALMLALLNVQLNDPLFGISPQRAQELLEGTSWIRRAHIQRRLPDTLYIRLTERQPTAILSQGGRLTVLDESAVIIDGAQASNFPALPVLSGDGAQEAMVHFIAALNNVSGLDIIRAERAGHRRWNVTLRSGIILKLPEDDAMAQAFRRILDAQRSDQVFDIPDIETIDLRFEDKLIINTKSGGANKARRTKDTNA